VEANITGGQGSLRAVAPSDDDDDDNDNDFLKLWCAHINVSTYV
jgi:hypothetical protein